MNYRTSFLRRRHIRGYVAIIISLFGGFPSQT